MRLILALLAYVVACSGFLLLNNSPNGGPMSDVTPSIVPAASTTGVLAASTETHPTLIEINAARATNNLSPIQFSTAIKSVAATRTSEMSKNYQYSHTRSDGTDYSALLERQDYSFSCENLQLQETSSINDAVASWLQSDSHRNCLLRQDIVSAALSVERFGTDHDVRLYVLVFIATSK
jgi:uncharacterized protein YkwD